MPGCTTGVVFLETHHDVAQHWPAVCKNKLNVKDAAEKKKTKQLTFKALQQLLQVTVGAYVSEFLRLTQVCTHHLVSPLLVPLPPAQSKYLPDGL